jgi:DNA-binding IclR family transcriptional regulator
MALGELRRHELEDVGRDLEVGEVDRRDAVLLREEVGQLGFIENAELGQALTQPCTRFTLLFLRFLQLRQRDQILADEQLTQSTHSHSRDADRHTDQSVIEDISRA